MALDLTGFRLTYDDEFNTFTWSPDGTSGYQTTFYYGGRSLPSNGEQEYYSDPTVGVNPFSLQNGELTITAAPGANPGGLAYNSGLITTEGMFTQTYGYFEIRAELPQGAGMWPAFWLLPADKSWPPELDPLEAFGATNANGEGGATSVHVGAISGNSAASGGSWVTMPNGGNIYTGYHTYGVDWEPTTITYYIDGQQVYQLATPSDMNKPMYMLANLAVGGNWVGSPAGETGQMKIDYMRAYSNDPNATGVALQTISSPDGANTSDLHGATSGAGLPTTTNALTVRVAEDAWSGDAQFYVSVDGIRLSGIYTATANHSVGQWQNITVAGNFGSTGYHTVDVTFTNDTWGGTLSTDRNLYVQSVTVNGVTVSNATANNATNGMTTTDGSQILAINGTATYAATAVAVSDTVQSAVSTTLDATTHNLTLTGTAAINGTGNDLANNITGNDAANVLQGLGGNDTLIGAGGNDTLDGGAGADSMAGGLGNDSYAVDNLGDVVTENVGEGTDLVTSLVSYTLTANVENLTLAGTSAINGTGNDLANVITGNDAANALQGLGGNDTLIGAGGNDTLDGGTGADSMAGGVGNDSYVVDNLSDVVTENVGEGADLVSSSITYTLAANVENLTLTGTAAIDGTGNGLNNQIVGNAANNALDGAAGNDTIDAGDGNDTITGATGDDALTLGNGNDVVIYRAGDGNDTITGFGTQDVIRIFGEASFATFADIQSHASQVGTGVVVQLAAGDSITLSNTTLAALTSTEFAFFDAAGNPIVPPPPPPSDVQSAVSTTLDATSLNLTLTGTAPISGTGNALNNTITGNVANNVIDGLGGADTMIGGAGDDVYYVDSPGDLVTEASGAGSDEIRSTVTYALSANVENLALAGAASINGTGNTLDNIIVANVGANVLAGGDGNDVVYGQAGNDTIDAGAGNDIVIGGAGNDTITLGAGSDVVIFNVGDGNDTIVDFSAQQDVIRFVGGGFTSLADLQSHATQIGTDVLLQLGTGDSLTLDNMTLSSLSGVDFVFANSLTSPIGGKSGNNATLRSSTSVTLDATTKNLILTGSTGTDGTGNGSDNSLTGNSGTNALDGGVGADTMAGGAGNDVYYVDNPGDVVTEAAGAGIDEVRSSVSYSLSANVENLTLTGSASISGTGNALDNVITGNGGANALSGGSGDDIIYGLAGNDTIDGGTGSDILVGGLGNDTITFGGGYDLMVYNRGDGNDVVTDFTSRQDIIQISGETGIASFTDVLSHAMQVGANLVIQLATGDSITLNNTTAAALNNSDFAFA